jgi:hypothetical protein
MINPQQLRLDIESIRGDLSAAVVAGIGDFLVRCEIIRPFELEEEELYG